MPAETAPFNKRLEQGSGAREARINALRPATHKPARITFVSDYLGPSEDEARRLNSGDFAPSRLPIISEHPVAAAAALALGTFFGIPIIHEIAQEVPQDIPAIHQSLEVVNRVLDESGLLKTAYACLNNATPDANNHCPEVTPRIGIVTAPSTGIYTAAPTPNYGVPMQTGTGELDIRVIADANGNGAQDYGDIGLADNISLVDQNGSVSTTQTNAFGVNMSLAAGRYRVYPAKIDGYARVSTPGVAYDNNGNPFIDNVQVNPSAITTLWIGETNAVVLLPPGSTPTTVPGTSTPSGSAPLPFGNAPLIPVTHTEGTPTPPAKTTLPPTGMRSGETFELIRILDFDEKPASERITKLTINNQGKVYPNIPVLFAPPSVESVRLNGISLAPMQTNHITREPNEMSQLPENENNLLVTAHRGKNENGQPMLGNLIAEIKQGATFTVTLGGKEVTYKAISAGVVADARQDIKETDQKMVTFVTCDASLDWSTNSRVIVHAIKVDGASTASAGQAKVESGDGQASKHDIRTEIGNLAGLALLGWGVYQGNKARKWVFKQRR